MRRSLAPFCVVAIALVQSALIAGIIFGWPAFVRILSTSGVFLGDACTASNTTSATNHQCALSQRSSFAFVYTAASSLFIFSSLPGGMLLDRCGPAFASGIGGVIVTAGFALAAECDDRQVVLAFMLIGAGCSIAYSTSLKTAFLFRPSARTPIIGAVNALFDASALVPLLLHTISQSSRDPTLGRAFTFYGMSGLSATIFGLWVLSWHSMRSTLRLSALQHARDGPEGAGLLEGRPEKVWPLQYRPFRSQCHSPQLWLLSCWMSIMYLRCSFYLASARASLQALGDGPDETYMSTMLTIQPISIICGPPTAFLLERYGYVRIMYTLSLLSCLGYACALIPSLKLQIATFIVNSMVRAGMYPTAIGYLAKTFGDKTLGKTTGFMFVACGVTNLAVYPLSVITNVGLAGDVRPVLAALCVLPIVPHLLIVWRLGFLRAGMGPFDARWKAIMHEVQRSTLVERQWSQCPICMARPMKKPMELSCTHVLCSGCASKMSGAGMQKCPICRHPHLLDPKMLKERHMAWREAYGGWRQGKVKGAAGEVTASRKPTPAKPPLPYSTTSLLISALDLAVAKPRPGIIGHSSSPKRVAMKRTPVSSVSQIRIRRFPGAKWQAVIPGRSGVATAACAEVGPAQVMLDISAFRDLEA